MLDTQVPYRGYLPWRGALIKGIDRRGLRAVEGSIGTKKLIGWVWERFVSAKTCIGPWVGGVHLASILILMRGFAKGGGRRGVRLRIT